MSAARMSAPYSSSRVATGPLPVSAAAWRAGDLPDPRLMSLSPIRSIWVVAARQFGALQLSVVVLDGRQGALAERTHTSSMMAGMPSTEGRPDLVGMYSQLVESGRARQAGGQI